MNPLLKFNLRYFIIAAVLFVVEVLIAKFAHDEFIRPYVGHTLVVILVYCAVKSFISSPVLPTAISVLLFAFLIEALQYMHLINKLGLQRSKIAPLVLGNSFAWIDLLAYCVGFGLILFFEKIIPA